MNNPSLDQALKRRLLPPDELAAVQLEGLRRHLRTAARSSYYSRVFAETGLHPEDIKKLDDLALLPLTARADLDREPDAFQAVADEAVVDLAATSGTSGRPVVVPYTRGDLERLAFNETVNFWRAGLGPHNRVLLTVTLDRCFVAGLAYYSGITGLGATAVRSGPGQPGQQWEILNRLQPDTIVGVPSFLLTLARWGAEQGIAVHRSNIKTLVTIGEPLRRADHCLTPMGEALRDFWDAELFASYGSTEMETAFCDCPAGCGGHVHPDMMLAEVVDEEGRVLPPGMSGEVVVTPLGVEGMPLVRFRTGDIARIHTEPCACGWTTSRVGPVEGRLAQRLKFRGTTLYPEAVFQALQEISIGSHAYLEVRSAYDLSDEVTVVVGADPTIPSAAELETFLQSRLRVKPRVVIKPREVVIATMTDGGARKSKKFFDFREDKA